MVSKTSRTSWDTNCELEFIAGLGSFTERNIHTHEYLKQMYKSAMRFRKDWGKIDRKVIEKTLETK